jgi:hypothetical protein
MKPTMNLFSLDEAMRIAESSVRMEGRTVSKGAVVLARQTQEGKITFDEAVDQVIRLHSKGGADGGHAP